MKVGGQEQRGLFYLISLMMKGMIFLMSIVYCSIISCQGTGAGTLGSLGIYSYNVSFEEIEEKLDSLESSVLTVPSEFQDQLNWSEKGYDFLQYWTFYWESNGEQNMMWISKIENQNQTQIAVRQVYDFKNSKWIKAVNVSSENKIRYSKQFEENVLSRLNLYYEYKN